MNFVTFAKLALAAGALIMLESCAMAGNSTTYPKFSYLNKLENEAKIVGGHRVDIVGPVTWQTSKACSVIDFVTFATSQNNNIHDVINIRADETKEGLPGGMEFKYSCKYWGLSVRYVPVDGVVSNSKMKGKMTFSVNDAEID